MRYTPENFDRLTKALQFYARGEHWMGITEDAEAATVLVAIGRTGSTAGTAEARAALCAVNKHQFGGWQDFPDGSGGEQVCKWCGLGAMASTLQDDY